MVIGKERLWANMTTKIENMGIHNNPRVGLQWKSLSEDLPGSLGKD